MEELCFHKTQGANYHKTLALDRVKQKLVNKKKADKNGIEFVFSRISMVIEFRNV